MQLLYVNFIFNAALLIAIVHLYSLIRRKNENSLKDKILLGILFGGAAILGMHLSVLYNTGIIYDGRSIILSIAGLFGGFIVALISASLALFYRIYIGGAGVWAGISTVFFCTITGVIYRKLIKDKPETLKLWELYVFGVSVHIIMLASQILIQPFPLGLTVIKKIWLPIMIVFPAATALIGIFLRDEENRIKTEEARQAAEQKIITLNEELNYLHSAESKF